MRRVLVIAAMLVIPFINGCLPYCVYPTYDYTPDVKLNTPPSEVHAFRVDINLASADKKLFDGPVFEVLSEIQPIKGDEIPSQSKTSASYGFIFLGMGNHYITYSSHTFALRLYRPGYNLVEVKPGDKIERVDWKPAADLKAEETALDDLFPIKKLEYGLISVDHRNAILFGAKEYERLAAEYERHAVSIELKEKSDVDLVQWLASAKSVDNASKMSGIPVDAIRNRLKDKEFLDAELFLLLANGMHPKQAEKKCGVTEKDVNERLIDPGFMAKLEIVKRLQVKAFDLRQRAKAKP